MAIQSWLSLNKVSAVNGITNVQVKCNENFTKRQRKCVVDFTTTGTIQQSEQLTITQEPQAEQFYINGAEEFRLAASGGQIALQFTTNKDGFTPNLGTGLSINDRTDLVELVSINITNVLDGRSASRYPTLEYNNSTQEYTPSYFIGEESPYQVTMIMDVKPNSATFETSYAIYCNSGSQKLQWTIKQNGVDAINIYNENDAPIEAVNFEADGGTITIKVASDSEFVIS